ncbi:MAG: VanZ family protein [Proteobacteria bacterium]|nr:VanZ family protein [Pseudomonadota bacterium]
MKAPTFSRQNLVLFKYWYSLGLLGVFGIFYFSLIPSPPEMVMINHGDKLHHFLAYGGIMIWFCQIFKKSGYLSLAIIFTLQGVAIEVLQGFTHTRTMELSDILANSTGVLFAFFLARKQKGSLKKKIECIF